MTEPDRIDDTPEFRAAVCLVWGGSSPDDIRRAMQSDRAARIHEVCAEILEGKRRVKYASDEPTEGAAIRCCRCNARPYADIFGPPGARVDFDLMRLDDQGGPAESPDGKWRCSRHFKRLGGGRYETIGGDQ
jgi:hypothetical protein